MIGHKVEQAVTVRALRGAAPYIHMYKGKVFVIKAGGGAFRPRTPRLNRSGQRTGARQKQAVRRWRCVSLEATASRGPVFSRPARCSRSFCS